MRTVIFLQSWGCGDIIFCQSIAQNMIDQGDKVIWPVESIYASLAKHFHRVAIIDKVFVNVNYGFPVDMELNGVRMFPLRFSDSLMKVPYTDCMKSKYMLSDMDWTKWKEKCYIKRDYIKEVELFTHLKLDPESEYNLISQQFTTGGQKAIDIVPPDNGLVNVFVEMIPGFTLIDWMGVIEGAATIHAVSSANIYLFELYRDRINAFRSNSVFLYVRRPNEQNHDNYSYILTPDAYNLMP